MYYQKEVFKKIILECSRVFRLCSLKQNIDLDFVFAFSDEDLDVECSNWSDGAKDTPSEDKYYIQPKWKKKKRKEE